MYKVFSGEKCIIITEDSLHAKNETTKLIQFVSAEDLLFEYNQFISNSRINTLVIVGNALDQIWKVFCSLFVYIEAAGGVVKNEKDEFLMIYRLGHWDFPKGKIEVGETPEIASVREVEEECGINHLIIGKPLPSVFHIYNQKGIEFLKRTYWFTMVYLDALPPIPQLEEGIVEVKWMSKYDLNNVKEKMFPSIRELIPVLISS